MDQSTIFAPFFAMIFLTLVVWVYMYARRIPFIQNNNLTPGQLSPAEFARISPPAVSNPSDNLKNLFEMPVLFYALVLYLYVTHGGRPDVRGRGVGVRRVPGVAQRGALHGERGDRPVLALRRVVAGAVGHGGAGRRPARGAMSDQPGRRRARRAAALRTRAPGRRTRLQRLGTVWRSRRA